MSDFNTNDRVTTPKGNGVIIEIKSGWVTVHLDDGDSQKFRAKQLEAEVVGKPTQAQQLAKYREHYVPAVTAAGNMSAHNGDPVAMALVGKDADAVMLLADAVCPIKGGQTHEARYQGLNEGSKRMNAGNKLRAAYRRGDWTPGA